MGLLYNGIICSVSQSCCYFLSKAPSYDFLAVIMQGLSWTSLHTVSTQALRESDNASTAFFPFRFNTRNEKACSLYLEPWGDQHSSAPECRMSYFGGGSTQSDLRASFKDKLIILRIKNEVNCIYLWPIKLAFTFKLLRHWILSRRKYSTELFKIQLRKEAFPKTFISEIVNSEYS